MLVVYVHMRHFPRLCLTWSSSPNQRELFARNFVVPPVEYGYEDQVESGEGIGTPRGTILPRPERSEYVVAARPRGVGVDAELAGWLTGLHGALDVGSDGAAAGYHRMYVRLSAVRQVCRLACAILAN